VPFVAHLTKRVVDGQGVETSNEKLHFFYDSQSRPAMVEYEGAIYRYVHNLQGDIVAIVDAAGTPVVEYKYDAWGSHVSAAGFSYSSIGVLNPFRYRDYSFDAETNLYYSSDRYYSPQLTRFINADSLSCGHKGLLANNKFSYCANNPVVRADTNGNFWGTIFDIVSFCVSVVEVIHNPTDIEAWVFLVGDTIDLLPVVSGVGEITKAIRVAGKLDDGFGILSKAKEYGIQSYRALRKTLSGTGLEAHHIIEKRFFKHVKDFNTDDMLSVAVTKEEHKAFTQAWRDAFKYGTDYSELEPWEIWEKASEIYRDYPELLEAAHKELFG